MGGKKLRCHLTSEQQALILLQDFVRECKQAVEKDEEWPGSDAVDYVVALYEQAKAIVRLNSKNRRV